MSLIVDFTLRVSGSGDDKKREMSILVSLLLFFWVSGCFFFANSARPKIPQQHWLSEFCAEQLLLRNTFSGLSGFLSPTQKLALSSSFRVFKDASFLPLIESMEAGEPVSMAK